MATTRTSERWASAGVMPGEVARCFDCELVAAGLMPSAEQLAAFRHEHGATDHAAH